MAKVLGLGGIFFKSPDPKALVAWYAKWLGLEPHWETGVIFQPAALPKGAYTVWSAFEKSTDYFKPADRDFMMNLVVDDLDAMLVQVRGSGALVAAKVTESEFGRFAWFVDPDGNKVELWAPAPAK